MIFVCTKRWINKCTWSRKQTRNKQEKNPAHTKKPNVMRTAGEGAGGCRRGKKQRDTEGGMSSASHLECQTLAVHLGIFQRQPKITCLYLYTAFYIFFISPSILGFYPPTTLLSSLYLSIIPALLHISPHSFFVTCLHILATRWDLVWAVGWGSKCKRPGKGEKEREKGGKEKKSADSKKKT